MNYSTPQYISSTFGYGPFGMTLEGRSWEAGSGYRYGFNGKEQDDEVSGNGNQYDYGFRIYNPRIGKFLSVDPLTKNYAELTPFQFASNTPIFAIDIDGLEAGGANAILGNKTNPVLNPNLPHIEYDYQMIEYENFRGKTKYNYTRTLHYYSVPVNRLSAKALRNEGKVQTLTEHEYENGKQWQYIGPFDGSTSSPVSSTTASITINESGAGDEDAPFNSTYSIPSATSGVTFSGAFNPIGTTAGSAGINNQITITDGSGNVLLPPTGFIGAPITINTSTATSNTISVTITPNPAGLAAAGLIAGDADNWTLTGTLSGAGTPATTSSTTIYNSTAVWPRPTDPHKYIAKRQTENN